MALSKSKMEPTWHPLSSKIQAFCFLAAEAFSAAVGRFFSPALGVATALAAADLAAAFGGVGSAFALAFAFPSALGGAGVAFALGGITNLNSKGLRVQTMF